MRILKQLDADSGETHRLEALTRMISSGAGTTIKLYRREIN